MDHIRHKFRDLFAIGRSVLETPSEGIPGQNSGRLPPEIVICVLQDFARGSKQGDTRGGREGMASLLQAALVSKVWHPLATDLIYHNPLLTKPRHVRRFLRTIENSPILAARVKEMTFIDNKEESSGIPFSRPRGSEAKQTAHVKRVKSDLTRLLHHCTSLHTLTISLMYLDQYAHIWDFAGGDDVIPNIRNLTVYDRTLEAV